MKKSIVIASLLLSACAPSSNYKTQLIQHCEQTERTNLAQAECFCDTLNADYQSGKFNARHGEYMLLCSKMKVLGEKIDKKEITEAEASAELLEWNRQMELQAEQARLAEEQRQQERALNQAIINKLNQPQVIQNNSMNCTSRLGYGGVVNTSCY